MRLHWVWALVKVEYSAKPVNFFQVDLTSAPSPAEPGLLSPGVSLLALTLATERLILKGGRRLSRLQSQLWNCCGFLPFASWWANMMKKELSRLSQPPLDCGSLSTQHGSHLGGVTCHIARIERPKQVFFSQEAAQIWVMWRKWFRLKDQASWLPKNPVASCLGHWGHVLEDLASNSDDTGRQAAGSVPKEQWGGGPPVPCCSTQGNKSSTWGFCPVSLGKPSRVPLSSGVHQARDGHPRSQEQASDTARILWILLLGI